MVMASAIGRFVRMALAALVGLHSCALAAQEKSDSGTAVLIFAGDIMLAETAGDAITQGRDPFEPFASIFKAADACIGNLECVVSTKGSAIKDKIFTFRAHPRVLPVVARHFGVVSLANNHTGDFGHEAFVEQLALLGKAHIAHIGGGRNCAEARLPHMLEVNGLRIALLGYNDFMPRSFEAGPSWPGVAWCVAAQVKADIKAARSIGKADLVIPFMHWGDEHEPENDRQKKLARQMIDAGADAVIGGHPHVTQGVEYYKGKLIVYSLGNFVFNGFKEGPARIGWVLRMRVDRQGLLSWDTVVAHLDEEGIPHPQKAVASPSGHARQGSLEQRQALVDSAFLKDRR